MVDFIKLIIPPQDEELWLNSPLLEFKRELNDATGEVEKRREAQFKGLKIIKPEKGRMRLQGSIHKYKNEGIHNANDFTITDLANVIADLSSKFKVDMIDYILINIEIGTNIFPPILKSKEIINCVLTHGIKDFTNGSYKHGTYKEAVHDQYRLKIYDKYAQYTSRKYKDIINLPDKEIMRIELSYNKMIIPHSKGLFTLRNLFSYKVQKNLIEGLKKTWNEVYLYDPTIEQFSLGTYIKQTKVFQWSNAYYWLNLNKQRRHEQKKYYDSVIDSSSLQIKKKITNTIESKWCSITDNSLPNNRIVKTHFVTN